MFLIVVNSKSGKGHARRRASEFIDLCKENGVRYKVVDKESAEDTKRDLNVELLNHEYKTLIAVGGDGLVNLCVQHVAQKPVSLGVLPAGTGNDFARAVGARYWPMVSMSMWCARMSRITAKISSSVSPKPTIRPLLVGTAGNRALNFFSRFSENW